MTPLARTSEPPQYRSKREMKREIDTPSKIKADGDQYYSDAVEELAGLGISEEQAQSRIEAAGSFRVRFPPSCFSLGYLLHLLADLSRSSNHIPHR